MYTDGITEAFNNLDEMFGEEKLLKFLQDNRSLSAQMLSGKIVDEVLRFSGAIPQADDITLVVMKT